MMQVRRVLLLPHSRFKTIAPGPNCVDSPKPIFPSGSVTPPPPLHPLAGLISGASLMIAALLGWVSFVFQLTMLQSLQASPPSNTPPPQKKGGPVGYRGTVVWGAAPEPKQCFLALCSSNTPILGLHTFAGL